MVRTLRTLSMVLATLVLLILPASAAHADGESWKITRYDVMTRLDQAGTATVTINLDFDFGNELGRGPFITLVERQAVAGDPDVWRMVDIKLGAVTSSTGAPTTVATTHEDGSLVLRIGDEDKKILRGVQSYTITYTARGLIAPNHPQSGMDEFTWNAIGPGWQVPLSNVSVTVTGPTTIQKTACFWGENFNRPCDAESTAGTATFSTARLAPGQGMQVVAGFPAGTFTDAQPIYTKRVSIQNMFPVTPLTASLTAVLGALGVGAVLLRTRRAARDEVYLGLTPGVRPLPGTEPKIGRGAVKAPVAVAFTPPKGARPGEIGVLTDARADDVDVTATILDLAARGHFQIVESGKKTWRFVQRQGPSEPLTPAEQHVMATLFKKGPQVTTEDLTHQRYHDLLPGTRKRLYQRVTKNLHWFKGSPVNAQALAVVGGIGIIVLGAVVALALGYLWGFGLLGLAAVATGLTILIQSGKFGRRTAEGSAVLAETKGFELYLRTAEADQIKFEEGIDVFSRYLPYAVIFGVTDRWVRIFGELAAQGRYHPSDWYVGPTGYFYGASFGHAVSSLSGQLSSSMHAAVAQQTQATVSSSGGSGFSGGGGFGGGGGGGW